LVHYALFRDTAGQEEYARLRPLAYSNADIFLIAFSVNEKSTFVNAVKKVVLHLCSGTLKFIAFPQDQ
jgi:GTPase SAR1 family protein